MNKKIQKQLENQIKMEFFSAYLYLDLANKMDAMAYPGFSKWLYVQAQEEMTHGMYIRSHLLDRCDNMELLAIDMPDTKKVNTPLDAFKLALNHEKVITKSINDIAVSAFSEGDHATYSFLGWFVNEQVEEEANFSEIVTKLQNLGDNPAALYVVDSEMGARVFVDSTPIANQV